MSPPEVMWLLGRLLLGGLFVVAGIRHVFIFTGVAQAMAARAVPLPNRRMSGARVKLEARG